MSQQDQQHKPEGVDAAIAASADKAFAEPSLLERAEAAGPAVKEAERQARQALLMEAVRESRARDAAAMRARAEAEQAAVPTTAAPAPAPVGPTGRRQKPIANGLMDRWMKGKMDDASDKAMARRQQELAEAQTQMNPPAVTRGFNPSRERTAEPLADRPAARAGDTRPAAPSPRAEAAPVERPAPAISPREQAASRAVEVPSVVARPAAEQAPWEQGDAGISSEEAQAQFGTRDAANSERALEQGFFGSQGLEGAPRAAQGSLEQQLREAARLPYEKARARREEILSGVRRMAEAGNRMAARGDVQEGTGAAHAEADQARELVERAESGDLSQLNVDLDLIRQAKELVEARREGIPLNLQGEADRLNAQTFSEQFNFIGGVDKKGFLGRRLNAKARGQALEYVNDSLRLAKHILRNYSGERGEERLAHNEKVRDRRRKEAEKFVPRTPLGTNRDVNTNISLGSGIGGGDAKFARAKATTDRMNRDGALSRDTESQWRGTEGWQHTYESVGNLMKLHPDRYTEQEQEAFASIDTDQYMDDEGLIEYMQSLPVAERPLEKVPGFLMAKRRVAQVDQLVNRLMEVGGGPVYGGPVSGERVESVPADTGTDDFDAVFKQEAAKAAAPAAQEVAQPAAATAAPVVERKPYVENKDTEFFNAIDQTIERARQATTDEARDTLYDTARMLLKNYKGPSTAWAKELINQINEVNAPELEDSQVEPLRSAELPPIPSEVEAGPDPDAEKAENENAAFLNNVRNSLAATLNTRGNRDKVAAQIVKRIGELDAAREALGANADDFDDTVDEWLDALDDPTLKQKVQALERGTQQAA